MAAGTIVVAAGRWAPSAAVLVPGAGALLGVRTRFADLDGVVLTFDDGPHLEGTTAILAELERTDARALFFVTGQAVDRNPTLARELAAAGHELGAHGYTHQSRRQWTRRMLLSDTRRCLSAITAASGVRPRFYRPPHGALTFAGRRAVCELGLEPLLWSRWGKDWRGSSTPETITRTVTRSMRAGDVILLHDSDANGAAGCWRRTAAALPEILEAFAVSGLRVTLPAFRGGGVTPRDSSPC